ncbi:MAG: cupredoxin domain-containing protein, partial [Thermomicrobiales bacterium]
LHKSPVGITTHVIGFGTTAEEQATLNGIAKAGGGQLLGSNNAGQLMDALFSILEKLDVVAETGTGETRDSPLGVGRIGKVGDYEISVLSVTPNANEVGPTKNSIAPPAGEGNQYFMARVALTYRGVGSGVPKNDLRFQAVGELGKGYRDSFECAAGMEDSVDGIVDVFEDGSAEGDLCWEISTKDENSLEMYVKFGSSPGAQTVWFSLGNPIAIKSDSLATTVPSGVTESTETPIAETFITLVATDIKFSRTEIRVPANTEFTIKLTNEGVLQHAFAIDSLGIKTAPLNNGDYSTISSALPPGTYDFYCPIPGHKEAGMVGTLIVE